MTDEMDTVTEERSAKTAYAYSHTTGEYLGVVMAEPDQLDDDNWLLPANATFTTPTETEEGEVAVWQDDAWSVVIDQRGSEYWDEDGNQYSISELGVSVPEEALLEAPIIPPTLEEQTALANEECTTRIEAEWSQVGQINASLGVYDEAEKAACTQWIAAHRTVLTTLLAREDLLEIDVTDDAYWQIVIEEVAEDTVEDVIEEVAEEATEDVVEETADDVTEEATEDVVEETAEDVTEEATESAADSDSSTEEA